MAETINMSNLFPGGVAQTMELPISPTLYQTTGLPVNSTVPQTMEFMQTTSMPQTLANNTGSLGWLPTNQQNVPTSVPQTPVSTTNAGSGLSEKVLSKILFFSENGQKSGEEATSAYLNFLLFDTTDTNWTSAEKLAEVQRLMTKDMTIGGMPIKDYINALIAKESVPAPNAVKPTNALGAYSNEEKIALVQELESFIHYLLFDTKNEGGWTIDQKKQELSKILSTDYSHLGLSKEALQGYVTNLVQNGGKSSVSLGGGAGFLLVAGVVGVIALIVYGVK